MIMDERLEFADTVAASTAAPATFNIGDQVDLGPEQRDVGDSLFLIIEVDTAFTSGGAATVDFKLVTDSTAVPSTDGSATEHLTTGPIAVASLTTAFRRVYKLPHPGDSYERYMGVQTTVGTAALTAGAISAFLAPSTYVHKNYPDAVN